MRDIDIQGHRGARALFPENTLEGFKAAAGLGVTAFELDVAMTRDGVVVVSHDAALNPDITRDASGAWLAGSGPLLHHLSHAGLVAYDVGRIRPGSHTAKLFPEQVPFDGARIPTLASILTALPAARFTIEIKTDPRHPEWTAAPDTLAEATLAVVDAADASGRVMVEAFDWRVQRHVRRVRPDMPLAWLTRAETMRQAALWWQIMGPITSVPACVAAEGGPVWAPDVTTLTQADVDAAHRLGLKVLPWTVNDPVDIRRMMAWNVDGLISDQPHLALELTR